MEETAWVETGRKARGQEEKHVVVCIHAGHAHKGEGHAAGPRSPAHMWREKHLLW